MAQTCTRRDRKNAAAARRQILQREPSPEARLAHVESCHLYVVAAHRILPRPNSTAGLRLRFYIGVRGRET